MVIFQSEDQKKSLQLVTAGLGGEGWVRCHQKNYKHQQTHITISIIKQLFVLVVSAVREDSGGFLVSNIYPFSRGISGYFSSA